MVWAATGLRLLGRPDEATQLLAERRNQADYSVGLAEPQTEHWMRQLYAFCAGGVPLEDMLVAADRSDDPAKLIGEVQFHAAAIPLSEGRRAEAICGFDAAHRSFDGEDRYTYHAKILLQKLQLDSRWPAWIPVSAEESPDTNETEPSHGIVQKSEEES